MAYLSGGSTLSSGSLLPGCNEMPCCCIAASLELKLWTGRTHKTGAVRSLTFLGKLKLVRFRKETSPELQKQSVTAEGRDPDQLSCIVDRFLQPVELPPSLAQSSMVERALSDASAFESFLLLKVNPHSYSYYPNKNSLVHQVGL